MSWRIVNITKRAKLDLKLNDMVVRGDETAKIHLSEISMVIIENTAVSMTAALMVELAKRKIKVIFCDEKRNPCFENVPYYGSHDTSLKVKMQMAWQESTKGMVWTEIVKEKIRQQMLFLQSEEKSEWQMLKTYTEEMKFNDETNREGHAAKVYFNALWGKDFTRASNNLINAALNYGYSILLSAVNREIVACGYITQIGLFHTNRFNMFNLSSDLMEPLRPLVDRKVFQMQLDKFELDEKLQLVNILNQEVVIDGRKQYVNNAIKIYVKSVFDALENNDVAHLSFCEVDV